MMERVEGSRVEDEKRRGKAAAKAGRWNAKGLLLLFGMVGLSFNAMKIAHQPNIFLWGHVRM